ncbi:MAG: DNA-3-methyladenine glycosylase 2 family protein [Planctomycetaceae bacterium]|nr:DNA-3-methyladenine glycosylase 2 family protein [Planctomycetaceae bacterium]
MSFDEKAVQAGIRHIRKRDPILGEVIRTVGAFTLKPRKQGYEILVRSILSQQISTSAASTIRNRLQDLLPGRRIVPQSLDALSDEQLQQVGISTQKRTYLRDLTRCTLDGSISFKRIRKASDEEAIEELIQVKGIGRWTAQMYLIFSLGRLDVFAPDDLGLRNAVDRLYDIPDQAPRKHYDDLAMNWSPYRSIASWYLWRSLENKD